MTRLLLLFAALSLALPARAALFEKTAPQARVVRIANASHYIYRSNPADVVREMNSFMDSLSR